MKPEAWSHPVLARLDDSVRLAAVALLNVADDEGYFHADPALIRASIFPFDESSSKARRVLDELSRIGHIDIREHPERGPIGMIVNFGKHQRIDRKTPSKIKHYYDSSSPRRVLVESSLPEQGTGNREQGRTSPASPKESTGADSGAPAADALADARPTPPTLDESRVAPAAETPLEQACGLLWAALSANGCRGTASHPSVVEMARCGVTVGELKAAIAEARKSNEGVLTPPYIAVIVERLRSTKAAPKTRGAKWASDDQALEVKARELGIAPKAGETYAALRQRVRQLCDDAARGAVR